MKKEAKYLIYVAAAVVVAGIVFALTVSKTDSAVNIEKPVTKTPSFPMITNLVTMHSFAYGPADAKVTVVEFFDPECESCAAVAPKIKNEMKYYEGKVRWVFRYMPYHHNSKNAIAALEAAKKQNLFLEAMTLLFETQHTWGEQRDSTNEAIVKLVTSIKGIDKAKFMQDLNDPATAEIIKKDQTEGENAGVKGTPSFFVNGVMLERLSLDELIARINDGLGEKK